jgi:hypothetical protein
MRRSWVALFLVAIVALALAARLVPYASSPYPCNVDGYPLVKGAERVVEFGSWDRGMAASGLEDYNSKMPAFSYLLAEFSMVVGMEPMECVQLMTAILGAACVVLVFALARRLTGSDLAALGAAAVLALHGFFVYATMAAWKEGLGLLMLILAFLLFDGRSDPRRRVLLALVLMLMPLAHHLTTLVAYSFVLTGVCADAVMRWRTDSLGWDWFACEGVTLGAPVAFAYSYFLSVEMEFFSEVNNMNDAALLGSVVFIGVVAAIVMSLPAMSKPWFIFNAKPGAPTFALLFDEKSLALLIGYGALLLNSRITLFPGTHNTTEALLVGVAPLVPVFLLAIAGFNLVRYSKDGGKVTLAAMLAAPLFLLLFAMAKSYDPASFFVAYRLFDYLDPFVAVAAGVGVAFLASALAKRLGRGTVRAKGGAFAVGVAFVLLVGSTTPLAYDWERVFKISSETKPQQFGAIEWAHEHGIEGFSSDHWNADIGAPYFEMDTDQKLPYHLRDGKGYGVKTIILEEEWKSRGAQTPISGRLEIPAANFDMALYQGNLVYSAGPPGDRIYIVMP